MGLGKPRGEIDEVAQRRILVNASIRCAPTSVLSTLCRPIYMEEYQEHLCGGCMETFEDLEDRDQHRTEAHPDECRLIRFCFCAFCGKQQHSDLGAYDHILEVHSAHWNEMVARMLKVSRLKEHHFQERWALAGSACIDTSRRATLKSVLKTIDDFWTFPMDKENSGPASISLDQEVHASSSALLIDECNNKKKTHQSPAIRSTASPLIEPSSSEIFDEEEQVPSTSADQPSEETETVQYVCVITRGDKFHDETTRKRAAFDVPSTQGPTTSVIEGILKKHRTEPPTATSLPQQMFHADLTSDGVTMPVLIPKEMICFHDNGTPYIDMNRHNQNAGPKKYAFLPEESLRKQQRQSGHAAHQQQQQSPHSPSTREPSPSQPPIPINAGNGASPATSSGSGSVDSSNQPFNHPNASRSSSTNATTLQGLLEASFDQPALNEGMPVSSKPMAVVPTPQSASSPIYDLSHADPHYVFWTGKDTSGRCPRCSYSTAGGPQTKRGHFVKCHYNIYYDKVKRAESELETFMFIALGHELPNRPRKCLYCSMSSSNYPDRKALLEHHFLSHPTEFNAFRTRFEQLWQKTGEFVDRAILEVIQASHLIQN
ncbi:hypothetical protein PRIPAC_74222 [Pristionchus pacificus]|uniref:C2H2-type domain-containing protein n=1 Tax=Pristionchus pacificus TaxID=54126 RepID=A0A2A6C0Y2_PRIPA|nr:hypothetical protein PRIPAC_74222 [Pristionchus pacificus]|eukprot:PDM71766.1 hypothetical protein PRIPAC_38173 [Pristionchus pacificus]